MDWKQLQFLASQLSSKSPPDKHVPAGVDNEIWRIYYRTYWFLRCVRRWYRFGDSLRRQQPLREIHEWNGEVMRWWLYESDYRRVYGDTEPEWSKLAALLLVLHAADPIKYPCMNELQMACFLAWNQREVLRWARAIATRVNSAHLKEQTEREWIVLRDSTKMEDHYRPDRLVITAGGERKFLFTESSFAQYA